MSQTGLDAELDRGKSLLCDGLQSSRQRDWRALSLKNGDVLCTAIRLLIPCAKKLVPGSTTAIIQAAIAG